MRGRHVIFYNYLLHDFGGKNNIMQITFFSI